MAMFNFFGEGEHRVFNYRPIYFDEQKEKRRRMFGAVDGSIEKEKEEGTYVPGSHIRGSLRDGAYSTTRSHMGKVQRIIGLVTLVLIVVILYFVIRFYSLL